MSITFRLQAKLRHLFERDILYPLICNLILSIVYGYRYRRIAVKHSKILVREIERIFSKFVIQGGRQLIRFIRKLDWFN